MSEHLIDAMPAETGENPLMQFLNSQFDRLHARVESLEQHHQSAPAPAPLVRSKPATAAAVDPVTITDPLDFLAQLLTTLTTTNLPLSDADIIVHRDDCKNAILALRAGNVGSTGGQTRDTIAYEAATRQMFVRVLAVLFDAARSRDPYAAQLQIT